MTEQEEREFHKVWDKLCDDGYRSAYEAARHCWVKAKRSQPIAALPKPAKSDGFCWAANLSRKS